MCCYKIKDGLSLHFTCRKTVLLINLAFPHYLFFAAASLSATGVSVMFCSTALLFYMHSTF